MRGDPIMRRSIPLIMLLLVSWGFSQEPSIEADLASVWSRVSAGRLKNDIDRLVSFHNRNTFSDTLSETQGIGAARRWLYQEFKAIAAQSKAPMKVRTVDFYQKLSRRYREATGLDSVRIVNVIAELEGSHSNRTLVINGHYDSRSSSGLDIEGPAPGANDDGTGTVALLELARLLSNKQRRNTIMLAAVGGEEHGLFGSTKMAKAMKAKGAPIEGVIANDMIGNITGGDGSTDNTLLRCFSPGPPESLSRCWALYLGTIAERYFPLLRLKMIFRLDRFGRGGDHSPFIREGFAGVRFTEPYENYTIQHSPYDLPEAMSFEYYKRTTQLNAALAVYWAESPSPPLITSIRRDSLYRTVISFTCDAPKEDLSGFKVFIRETDQGYWQEERSLAVPEQEEHRIWGEIYRTTLMNRDQDYYIFGLASVNKRGYESIPAVYDRDRIRTAAKKRLAE
jgi:hypothetical protein